MEYNVSSSKDWKTVIDVTVPSKDVQPKLDQEYDAYKKNAKLEGFRKGKVPTPLIKKMFGKQIETDVYQPFIQEAWQEIFKDNEFEFLDEPRLQDVQYDRKEGLSFKIVFDVQPKFEVQDYKGIELEKSVFQVKKEDVDNAIEELRQRFAMMYSVDGEAQEGHYLTADLQETDAAGTPLIGNKAEDQQIFLNKDDEQITKQLAGVQAGEERRVSVEVEHENQSEIEDPEHAGKHNHHYLVKVKEVKERRLPDLDDEFAKDVGDYETFKDLKKNIEASLKQRAETETEYQFNEALSDEVIKRQDLDAPQSMVERYLEAVVEDYQQRNQNNPNVDVEQVRQVYKIAAIREIKWHLIVQQLVEQEQIEVSDEELEARLKEMEDSGEKGKEQAEKIRNDDRSKERLKDSMLETKVNEMLIKNAKVKQVKKPWREAQEAQEGLDESQAASEEEQE